VAKDIVATESDDRVIQRLFPYRQGKVRRLDAGSRFVVERGRRLALEAAIVSGISVALRNFVGIAGLPTSSL